MKQIHPEMLKALRSYYPPGTRVELVRMEDPYTRLKPGDQGSVSFIDDTGRAADITPELIQGFDIRYLDFHTQKQLEQILPIYGIIFGPHRAVKASMLLDLEKGLPCEIDAINGAVWNWARRFNVSTPVNDQVVDIIKKIQSGELKPEPANLDRIDVPQLPAE